MNGRMAMAIALAAGAGIDTRRLPRPQQHKHVSRETLNAAPGSTVSGLLRRERRAKHKRAMRRRARRGY